MLTSLQCWYWLSDLISNSQLSFLSRNSKCGLHVSFWHRLDIFPSQITVYFSLRSLSPSLSLSYMHTFNSEVQWPQEVVSSNVQSQIFFTLGKTILIILLIILWLYNLIILHFCPQFDLLNYGHVIVQNGGFIVWFPCYNFFPLFLWLFTLHSVLLN